MSVRQLVLGLGLTAAMTSLAHAQDPRDPRCVDPSYGVVGLGGVGGDACQKAVDLFNYLTPQLGSAMAGGNATLGQGGALGGLGKFTVLLRVTAVRGALPDADGTSTSGGPAISPSSYQTEEMPLPLPSVDAAVGLFGGVPLGLTTVLGVDALGSVYYMPEYEDEGSVGIQTPDGSFKFGFGARVGLIEETTMLPAVSVTWMRRQLPRISIATAPSADDDISLANFDNRATSWRVVAGKRLGRLGVSVGAGKDSYESSAQLSWHVQQGQIDESQGAFAFDGSSVDATSFFGNLLLDLHAVELVGEIGQVTVSNLSSADFYNQFAEEPDASRLYASVGFRIGRD
jgi:hypothetical protein